MRIIAGALRGRHIEVPPGRTTRPMLDRIREALFSTIQDWLDGARVLDLFAGSGSLGLEALSRGAARVRFVEKDRRALEILARNLDELDLGERADRLRGDALDPASWIRPADLIFLDPPYALLEDGRSRRRLFEALRELANGVLDPAGIAVLHVPRRAILRAELAGTTLAAEERTYGTNALIYLRPAARAEAAPAGDAGPAGDEGAGEA